MSGLDIFNNIVTLVDLLRHRAEHSPEQVAYTFLVDGELEQVSFTHRALDQKAKAIAAYLQSCCQPGERAILLYQPGLDYVSAFFGCLYAGIIAVPAYPPRPNRSLARLQSIFSNAQATIALTSESIFTSLQRRAESVPELEQTSWLATDLLEDSLGAQWQAPSLHPDSLAFLQYTSGSTATPKGVMITHRNLLENLTAIHCCFEHTPQSQGVIWLPPYHDMGLIGGVLQPLFGGFPVVLMSPLLFLQRPIRWLEAISRHRGTTSGGPNFAYDLCVRRTTPEQRAGLDLSSWTLAFNGAEPIYAEVLEQFVQTFEPHGFRREGFYPCYGMAEATLIISGGKKAAFPVLKTVQASALEHNQVAPTTEKTPNTRTLVGCGHALPGQRVQIVNPETLVLCSAGEVGEIWVQGPSIAQGYWHNPEATAQNFQAHLASNEAGPFLRTGDLGFLEGDELFVTGRLKDLIIINGHNHYPQDIEWTVEHCNPLIRPNCAAGFSVEVSGEERLVVVAEVERHYQKRRSIYPESASESPNLKEIVQSIQQAVLQSHDLSVYTVALLKPGTIPKTSSGKIQRHACRALFLAGTLETLEAWSVKA
ncbi:MAG: fatty acyl-AMP ligase [Microcoleaceae cyanobacterium]